MSNAYTSKDSNTTTGAVNDAAVSGQGEFKPSVQNSEPLLSSGHQPGKLVGNDAVPEFHAKTLPAGSAPPEHTFQPNPISETPGQASNPDAGRSHGKESTKTDPLDFPGATSGDVHRGLGKPIAGQTAGDSKGSERHGLAGLGENVAASAGTADQRVDPKQRGLQREGAGQKDTVGDTPSAEEREPVRAEEL